MPKVALGLAHDAKSILGTVVPSMLLDVWRIEYQMPGEPTKRVLEIPKKVVGCELNLGMDVVVTVVLTQSFIQQMPDELPGLAGINGHKLKG